MENLSVANARFLLLKPRLHYDSDSVTVLSSTIKIVQLKRERLLFTLDAGSHQFFL